MIRRLLLPLLATFVLSLAGAPAMAQTLPLTLVASGLDAPVDIANAGDGSGRLFIVQKGGLIRILKNGVLAPVPFLDIRDLVLTGDERGLLGMTFHPDFAATRYLYVNYTRKPDGATVIARYRVAEATSNTVDEATEATLLVVPQPYANHNGGGLRFGPDGLLYIGMGDGGGGNDPENRAQNPQSLLGKMLRIDVDGGFPYAIPPANPHANGVNGRPEVWATGLRNPWRFVFDPRNGDLWIGDVGQDQREEVDAVPLATAAPNFGWRVVEGTLCTGLSGALPCTSPVYLKPVAEYTHAEGCSVTGGEINLGSGLPGFAGTYLFADFCNGKVWAAVGSFATGYTRVFIGNAGFQVSTFGVDEAGEIYLAELGGGRIHRLGTAVSPGAVSVVEYYHAGFDHYFITSDPAEIAGLDAGAFTGWKRTGAGFRAWPHAVAGSSPICRFYLPPASGDSHFFAADPAECDRVRVGNPEFVLESTAAMHLGTPVQPTGACSDPATQPLYRIWNQRPDTNHRYTTSAAVRDQMVAAGGVAEGYGPNAVAMCVPR